MCSVPIHHIIKLAPRSSCLEPPKNNRPTLLTMSFSILLQGGAPWTWHTIKWLSSLFCCYSLDSKSLQSHASRLTKQHNWKVLLPFPSKKAKHILKLKWTTINPYFTWKFKFPNTSIAMLRTKGTPKDHLSSIFIQLLYQCMATKKIIN